MMLKGANFEIVDLGTSVSPDAFATATKEHGASIVGSDLTFSTRR